MPTGTPADFANNTYCKKDDVLRFVQNDSTSLSNTDIDKFIEQKTRYIEKRTSTAFRDLTLSDLVQRVKPSSEQKRGKLSRRNTFQSSRDAINPTGSNQRWIDIQLPNNRISAIESIEVVTDDSPYKDITNKEYTSNDEDGLWRLINSRDGKLQVSHDAFDQTLSGREAGDRYVGARIRITYVYGRSDIRPDIREACAKLVAYELINSEAFGQIRPDNPTYVSPEEFTRRIKEEAEEVIDSYK